MFTSPTTTDQHTKRLLDILNTGFEPVVLEIKPEEYATEANCFFNVPDKIEKDGGSICYGWAILHNKVIYEAEAHAVWKSDAGELVDITPRESSFGSKTIMFVEDRSWTFKGRLIDNKRINVTNNPLIDHVIKIIETKMAIQIFSTRIERGKRLQSSTVSGVLEALDRIQRQLEFFIASGGTSSTSCFCGSGQVYISCHGLIDEGMKEVYDAAKAHYDKHDGRI